MPEIKQWPNQPDYSYWEHPTIMNPNESMGPMRFAADIGSPYLSFLNETGRANDPYAISNLMRQTYFGQDSAYMNDPTYREMALRDPSTQQLMSMYDKAAAGAPSNLSPRGVSGYYHMRDNLGWSPEKIDRRLGAWATRPEQSDWFIDQSKGYTPVTAPAAPQTQYAGLTQPAASYGPSANIFGGGAKYASPTGSATAAGGWSSAAPSNVTNAPNRVTMMPDTVYSPTGSAMRQTASAPASQLTPQGYSGTKK